MKYIDADKLIAEIERRMKCYDRDGCEPNDGKWVELVTMKHFVESLQQEQPEVDLDREIIKYKVPFTDESEYLNETTLDTIARHFYELGLNARKEETK